MKKLLTLIVLVVGFTAFSTANATTNNETYIPSTTNNNDQIVTGGEKQTKQYSFTLFDFFFNTDNKVKSDSSQIKEKAISPVSKPKSNSVL